MFAIKKAPGRENKNSDSEANNYDQEYANKYLLCCDQCYEPVFLFSLEIQRQKRVRTVKPQIYFQKEDQGYKPKKIRKCNNNNPKIRRISLPTQSCSQFFKIMAGGKERAGFALDPVNCS